MAINTLNQILVDKGRETLDLLLRSKRITVYEKLDGLNFGFYIKDSEPVFFKKNPKSKIGSVDRTLTQMYENPIRHISSLLFINTDEIQKYDGYTFGFIYFPSKTSSYISYDNIPLNHLVLSYVEDSNGTKIIDIELLNSFADLLNVAKPPIIFDGKLSNEQVDAMYKYVQSTEDEIADNYNNINFSEHLFNIICPEVEGTTLNSDLKKNIEGLIFRFENNVGDIIYSKIDNPYFEEIIRNNKSDKFDDDQYYLILSDIVDFLLGTNIESVNLTKKTYDDKYVELISKLFNQYINARGDEYKEVSISTPKYLQNEYNVLNSEKIENKRTLEIINGTVSFKEIFRIFLASFRKRRNKVNNIFNSSMNKHFNNIVDIIMDKCGSDIKSLDIEAIENSEDIFEFIDYDQYVRIYVNGEDSEDVLGINLEDYLRQTPDYITGYIESNFSVNNFLSSVLVKTKRKEKIKDGRIRVNLLIDNFDPLTNHIYDFILDYYEKNKIPFILISVKPRQLLYSESLLEKIFKSLCEKEEFENYYITDNANIKKIINNFSQKYKVEKIISNAKYQKFIEMQIDSIFKDNNYLDLYPNQDEVSEYYIADKSIVHFTNKALEVGSFTEFKKYVPEEYSNMFTEILAQYNTMYENVII